MSRIGRLPISVPAEVKILVESGVVHAEGPKGKLRTEISPGIEVKLEGGQLKVSRLGEDRKTKALHGLIRKMVANMVEGVSR